MSKIYELAKQFKRKYPRTIAFRIRSHVRVVEDYIDADEEVLYVFLGQKNKHSLDFVNTNIIVLTSKRIIIATKRIVFGYFYTSITPDMFNDITVKDGIIWGRVIIDTVKEEVYLSNIDSRALPEIEDAISSYMMEEKKKYNISHRKSDK